jgi:hypothetical protein
LNWMIGHLWFGFEAREAACVLGTTRWGCGFLYCVQPIFQILVFAMRFFGLLTSGRSPWFVLLFSSRPTHWADCRFLIILFCIVSFNYFICRP